MGLKNYLDEYWGYSKGHANRLINYTNLLNNLAPRGVIPAEKQARPLTQVEPEEQQEVWDEAVGRKKPG
jgi:hypothetical protein